MLHIVNEREKILKNENGTDVLVNKTKNALERFNRKLNEQISKLLTVQVFADLIRESCNEYVDLMTVTKLQKGRKQNHSHVVLPTIPVDFASFHSIRSSRYYTR